MMCFPGGGEVVHLLKIHPVFRAGTEVFAEAQGGGGGDALAAFDNGGDAVVGNGKVRAKPVLGDPQIREGFLEGLAGAWIVKE